MSATGDPYFDVERDVKQSIVKIREAFARLEQLQQTARDDELRLAQSELLSQLKTLNWDLDDISDSIAMVERNRAKYKLSDTDLAQRKAFVGESRAVANRMKSSVNQFGKGQQKNELLRNRLDPSRGGGGGGGGGDAGAGGFGGGISRDMGGGGDLEQQQVMLRQQDAVLDDVIQATKQLGQMGETIGQELGQQSNLISEVTNDVDETNNKILIAKQRLDKMLAAQSEQRLMCLVCMLIGVFVTLCIIVFEF